MRSIRSAGLLAASVLLAGPLQAQAKAHITLTGGPQAGSYDMIGSPNSYRFLLVGLGALAAFWLAWSVFGWVPVAGDLIRGAAILVTWLLGTAGFGAALLSRAGLRENFAGRLFPPEALTDEYLWATPQFGVSAARRPGSRTPTRGL